MAERNPFRIIQCNPFLRRQARELRDNWLLFQVNRDDVKYGTTLLQEAVTQAHVEMARILVQYGKADLDAQNDDGKTALHIASRAGQEALVDLLLEAGAKVNIQCLDETTSLHLAMWKSKANVVEKLIADEWAPLHWGVENGNFELVRLLINNGAKTNVVSKVG
eukprot:XP_014781613.1 PREDICTED: putative ankyrin repeat protein RF_0381 [Octopus bimaculoides]